MEFNKEGNEKSMKTCQGSTKNIENSEEKTCEEHEKSTQRTYKAFVTRNTRRKQ